MSRPDFSRDEVLQDSQATLRQVQDALQDFQDAAPDVSEAKNMASVLSDFDARPASLAELVRTLLRAYSEIMGVIDSLRQSRGILQKAAMERLHRTHEKLAEVTSATELAATDMLDGLDRALVLLDSLEPGQDSEPEAEEGGAVVVREAPEAAEVRGELREELHRLISLLQFQDITAQQLGYASKVLSDIEERLMGIAEIFDLTGLGLEDEVVDHQDDLTHETHHSDPGATTEDAEGRQSVADEIFGGGGLSVA